MFNESIKLTRKLLIAMGLELQRGTNILIDQDTKSYISFSGKFVKANNDVNKSLYVSEYDIKLDPLDPKCTKVMECLFAKYLEDASSEDMQNIPEVLSYFFDKSEDDTKYKLNIKFNDGTSWVGNFYSNKIICYSEAILSLDGTFSTDNLALYDKVIDESGEEK